MGARRILNHHQLSQIGGGFLLRVCYPILMKHKHERTLELIFAQPVSGNVRWADIEALFRELGAEIYERVTGCQPVWSRAAGSSR